MGVIVPENLRYVGIKDQRSTQAVRIVRRAPARFEGTYAFDHAKYLVINPGTPHALAIVGSANETYCAFAGDNAEDDIETTALREVFHAD